MNWAIVPAIVPENRIEWHGVTAVNPQCKPYARMWRGSQQGAQLQGLLCHTAAVPTGAAPVVSQRMTSMQQDVAASADVAGEAVSQCTWLL
jgi:hypothetical protein